MVHSEVYLNKYVVSIAPFSTPAFTPPHPIQKTALFYMLSLFNFSSIFQGVSWHHLPLCADAHGPVCCRRYIIPVFRLCLPPDRAPRGRRPFGVRPFSWTTDSLSSLSPTHNQSINQSFLYWHMTKRICWHLIQNCNTRKVNRNLYAACGLRSFYRPSVLCDRSFVCHVAPRDDMLPPPMAVRLAADLRPSADGSAVRTWLSCRQPACL